MLFRLDRFLTLYFFGPLAGLFPLKRGIHIPILMYHSISDEKEAGHPYFWINTSPARFAEQMKFLHDNGYKVIPLSTAVGFIRKGSSFTPESSTLNARSSISKPQVVGSLSPQYASHNPDSYFPSPITHHPSPCSVVLTFDDGYHDFLTHAFPVIKKWGFSATVYLPTAFIDSQKPGIRGKRHLSWGEVRNLQTEGIEFGSHTVNHPQLFDLKRENIEFELRSSRLEIEAKTGKEVRSFSYPYKFPEQDSEFINQIKRISICTGYENGVTTRIGTVHQKDEVFLLRRVPLNSADDLSFFKVKLEGKYNWLSRLQYHSKRARANISKKSLKNLMSKEISHI